MPQLPQSNEKMKTASDSMVSRLVLAVAVIEPPMTAPQIYEIWIKRETAGVSLLTWSFYLVAAGIWLWYGLKIKDKPVIVSSTLWVLFEGAVVGGLLLFG